MKKQYKFPTKYLLIALIACGAYFQPMEGAMPNPTIKKRIQDIYKKFTETSKTKKAVFASCCALASYCLYTYYSNKAPGTPITFQTTGGKNVMLVQGDITQHQFKNPASGAIVNAANKQLQGGGGVCGAIFNAAGWNELQDKCDEHPIVQEKGEIRCDVGDAKITPGGALAPRQIIHAVGPDCRIAEENTVKDTLLGSAYYKSLEAAEAKGITEVVFPSISTAIFGYDINEATPVAIDAIKRYFTNVPTSKITDVTFCTYNKKDYRIYRNTLAGDADLTK